MDRSWVRNVVLYLLLLLLTYWYWNRRWSKSLRLLILSDMPSSESYRNCFVLPHFPMRVTLRTHIVESLCRGSWALFHPATETLRADNRAILSCLKMDGWRMKGGWLSLKSDSPRQSSDTNGVNNHYCVQWSNPVAETNAGESLISMRTFAVAKCSAWLMSKEFLCFLGSKPSHTKICYSVAPHPPVVSLQSSARTHAHARAHTQTHT